MINVSALFDHIPIIITIMVSVIVGIIYGRGTILPKDRINYTRGFQDGIIAYRAGQSKSLYTSGDLTPSTLTEEEIRRLSGA